MTNKIEGETQFKLSDSHIYEILDVIVEDNGLEKGRLRLINIITGQMESYTIWEGDEQTSWYYVCLPTGDGEELEDYDVEDVFNINPIIFKEDRTFL